VDRGDSTLRWLTHHGFLFMLMLVIWSDHHTRGII
jgi:hypothetical protein